MATQSPPFALQNASHGAALFRQAAFSAFPEAGTLSAADLVVAAQSTPNMSVQVSAGRAWVAGTQVANATGQSWSTQAAYFGINDAPLSVTISAANATNPRIDTIYIAVNDAYYSGTLNTLVIGVATGTPAATPVAPAIPNNALALANIAVAANATSVVSGNITAAVGLPMVALGGINPVTSTDATAGLRAGQYRDHPSLGLERWDGAAWQPLGVGGDTGWITVTPATGWTAVTTNGDPGLRYRVRNGECFLSFHIAGPSGGWSGAATLFSLPVAPSSTHYIRATKDATDGVPSGEVYISTGGVAYINIAATSGNHLYGSTSFLIS